MPGTASPTPRSLGQSSQSADQLQKPVLSTIRFELVPFGFGRLPNPHDISQLHAALLPASPISKLGIPFMQKFYYAELPQESLVFGAVAYVDGKPAGFVSATADAEGFMGRGVLRDPFALILAVTWSFLLRPVSASCGMWEAIKLMGYRGSGQAIGEVLSLGVRAEFRTSEFRSNTGIVTATELLNFATAKLRALGVVRARVIVDDDNPRARKFYENHGWRPTKDCVPGWTVPSVEMGIEFDPPEG